MHISPNPRPRTLRPAVTGLRTLSTAAIYLAFASACAGENKPASTDDAGDASVAADGSTGDGGPTPDAEAPRDGSLANDAAVVADFRLGPVLGEKHGMRAGIFACWVLQDEITRDVVLPRLVASQPGDIRFANAGRRPRSSSIHRRPAISTIARLSRASPIDRGRSPAHRRGLTPSTRSR